MIFENHGFLMFSLCNRTLIGSLLLEQKPKQKLTHKMMTARLCLVADAQRYVHWETVFQMQTWHEDRRKANFYFPNYSVSLSLVV